MRISGSIVITLMMLGATVQAQNGREAVQNRAQINQGKRDLDRDIRELEAFKVKMEVFNRSFDARDGKINTLKADLLTDMAREVRQSEEKAKRARREIAQSSQEVRSERREVRDDVKDSNRGRYDHKDDKKDLARDRANTRDDKRDRKDDIRDFENQIKRADRQAVILKTMKTVNFSFDARGIEKSRVNRKLLNEFLETLRADVVATQREINEDKREGREDRRERKDDREERNEYDSPKKRRW
ncbi:hypothetical protein ACFSTE_08440 [Aquimarina hainanensis]|uniref:Uncharacterized protein n=1 Tax=Aquimarina hainanensis TaxID=1578017 RepID=A0ABW5N7B9_9FLAO